MRLDPWLEKSGLDQYLVSSLYLDSPELFCYEAVEQGERNRFKLRVRWYGENISDPVFLEEKKRDGETILKNRVQITKASAEGLMNGLSLKNSDFITRKASDRAVAAMLLDKIRIIRAARSCVVRYEREAWEGRRHDGVRVTFDRALNASPANEFSSQHSHVQTKATIFEVKYHGNVPEWLQSIIHRHSLIRQSVPKYVLCVDTLNECYGPAIMKQSHSKLRRVSG